MKKYIAILAIVASSSLPLITHADPYSGAYYAKVIQAPVGNCHYVVLGDNRYGYDLATDYFNDLSNGDYLYGGIQLGTQFAYDSTKKEPLTLDYYQTMMGWSGVVNAYYNDCPQYTY